MKQPKKGGGITMNRRPWMLTLLLVIVFNLSWATEAIYFECPILAQTVREAKGFTGAMTGAIYPADVSGIEELDAIGRGIVSLEGIQHLNNLQHLYCDRNRIGDLTPLQNLINLQTLTFDGNQVSDLTPLQHLINLQVLIFKNNQVGSIESLENLTNLQVLWFGGNQVSDLRPLQNLTSLWELYFWGNQVCDISPLVANTGLSNEALINMQYNNLNLSPGSQNMIDIRTLIHRGAVVEYEPQN